ncbi:hypothetical protein LJR230_002244 [Trinickia sp. LjRoot230]|uniref:hypothetical protein n=1 Tax=Trinickia sp. LjRoot230 TaxID=3342288 RepID=UPI003ED0B29A
MKTNRLMLIATTSLGMMLSSAAFAAAGGGGNGGGGGGGAGGSGGGGHGSMGGQGSLGGAGGVSASHMSTRGMTNTNGFESGDRDKGLARAADRASPNANLGVGSTHARTNTHTSLKAHHHRAAQQLQQHSAMPSASPRDV